MCSRREASKFLFSSLIQAVADPPRSPRVTPRGEGAPPVPCPTKRPPLGRSNRRPPRLCAPREAATAMSPTFPSRPPRDTLRDSALALPRARTWSPGLAFTSPAPPLHGHRQPLCYECVFDRPSPSATTSVFSTGPQGRVIRSWGPCKALWTARRFGRKLRKATQRRPGQCACWARRALGCAHVARRCLWCLVVHRLTKQRYLFRNPVTQFP